jgi:4-diphosphocytidyl-2-C-methyl-D-erythritol kinase
MKIRSYAKINLFLDITGLDKKDGYHYLDSLFQEVTLHDIINIKKSNYDKVEFRNATIPADNTVSKALRLFKEKFIVKESYSILINKIIPAGAGLGGGSSNAAAVLSALAKINNKKIVDLISIGEKIGSDVPFFFTGGLCRVKGKGETVIKMDFKLNNIFFIIVYPGRPISTKWAFSLIDDYNPGGIVETDLKTQNADIDFLKKIIYNKLQFFVFNNCKELAGIKTKLDDFLDSRLSFMSGSGSSLVYVYTERGKARHMSAAIRDRFGFDSFFCEPYYR